MSILFSFFKWLFSNLLTILLVTFCLLVLPDAWKFINERMNESDHLQKEYLALNAKLRAVDLAIMEKELKLEQENFDKKYGTKWECARHPVDAGASKGKIILLELLKEQQLKALQEFEKFRNDVPEVQNINKSLLSFLQNKWNERGIRTLGYVLLFVLIAPVLWSVFMYYGVAKLVEKLPPMKLPPLPGGSHAGTLRLHAPNVSVDFQIPAHQVLYLRNKGGDWGKQRTNIQGKTRFLWKWNAPLISIAADLYALLEYSGIRERNEIKLTSPVPDDFILRIDLNNSPGLVLRPQYLIGLTSGVEVRTCWSFNRHNLLSGRLRRVIFHGSGTIFIKGCWGIDCKKIDAESSGDIHRIEDHLLLAFEPDAAYSLCRTQTFWHYFRGSATLFDDQLSSGTFLTQNNIPRDSMLRKSGIEKFTSVLLNGIGNLLGL